jgi:hypothetical protein
MKAPTIEWGDDDHDGEVDKAWSAFACAVTQRLGGSQASFTLFHPWMIAEMLGLQSARWRTAVDPIRIALSLNKLSEDQLVLLDAIIEARDSDARPELQVSPLIP